MKTHDLIQGTPEWHAHRASHFNASDAPAMMGCSVYKTRSQLLHEMHTGMVAEVDAETQRRFADGHRFEALARPLAEAIIGEELYPVVGSKGKLSASFDGLTMAENIASEHKSLNDELRAVMIEGCTGADLQLMYRVQMEQQLEVSDSEMVLFMASKWDAEGHLVEERHCWYAPDLALRQQITAGWAQFEKDLANYAPVDIVEMPKADAIMGLPALFLHARGEITDSNLKEFGEALALSLDAARKMVRITDQDFANGDAAAKLYRETCKKLMLAKEAMLSQTVTIGEAARMIDTWHEDLRVTALKLEKDSEKEKEAKKEHIIATARLAYVEHVAALEKEIAPVRIVLAAPDFAGAMKGKRLIAAWQDAVDSALANGKIATDTAAKIVRDNLATLKTLATGYEFLFADLPTIAHKSPEDFTLLVTSRVSAQKKSEADKLEADRTRIAEEERVKAEAAAMAIVQANELTHLQSDTKPVLDPVGIAQSAINTVAPEVIKLTGSVVSIPLRKPVVDAGPPTLKLGVIADRLGFALTADFLKSLGFDPAATVGASKLYHESSFTHICAALVDHINQVQTKQAA